MIEMIQLPAIFSDGMVLQRGMPVPIWGRATPGSQITLSFQERTEMAQVAADGRWRIDLSLLGYDMGSPVMRISGDGDDVIIRDVVVGEVWICSGQSNMASRLNACEGGKEARKSANFPRMRFFPVEERAAKEIPFSVGDRWYRSNPLSCRKSSAVAFAFGRYLMRHVDCPVGLIQSAVGGTSAEAWMRPYPGCCAIRMPRGSWEGVNDPTFVLENQDLYRGMIQPFQPYAARGVVWYQGEANAGQAWEYRNVLPRLIAEWRRDFERDLPFIIIQIVPFGRPRLQRCCVLRESQLKVSREVSGTYLVVTDDVGESGKIHPPKKLIIGERAGRIARGAVYGHPVEYRSAECIDVYRDQRHLFLRFGPVGGGLVIRDGADEVRGFTVAGRDKRFVPAKAKIISRDVVQVGRPGDVRELVAARYGFVGWSKGNLNANDLPVSPFRTDSFRVPTQPEEGCAMPTPP